MTIIDFYKKTGQTPFDFLFKGFDPQLVFDKPPKEALRRIQKRGENIISSGAWDELDSDAHDKAFTVANVMKADILQLIYDEVEKAKSEGTSLKDFQDTLYDKLERAGYTGKTKGQLRVIYETNMSVAFAKNKYNQQKRLAVIKPFWRYTQRQKETKRKSHSKFHNKVFRHDDPIWSTIYPPSAFGCGCHVTALSAAEVKKLGLNVEKGSDYTKHIKGNDNDFNLKMTDQWKPDTSKLTPKLKKQADKTIKEKDAEKKADEKKKQSYKNKSVEKKLNESLKEKGTSANRLFDIAVDLSKEYNLKPPRFDASTIEEEAVVITVSCGNNVILLTVSGSNVDYQVLEEETILGEGTVKL